MPDVTTSAERRAAPAHASLAFHGGEHTYTHTPHLYTRGYAHRCTIEYAHTSGDAGTVNRLHHVQALYESRHSPKLVGITDGKRLSGREIVAYVNRSRVSRPAIHFHVPRSFLPSFPRAIAFRPVLGKVCSPSGAWETTEGKSLVGQTSTWPRNAPSVYRGKIVAGR